MIVIIDISVSADQFPLGRILEDFPDVEIELERLVPLQNAIIPLFWVDDENTDATEEALRADSMTKQVTELTRTGSRVLYEVEWSSEVNGFVDALLSADAQVLAAEGTADIWDFRLQFRSRSDLTRFRQACEAEDISLTLRRLYNPSLPKESGSLSDEQYEALTTAFTSGYFEVPRASNMRDLAATFGVSDSAFSQRIRRGISTLIAETLIPEFGRRGKRSDPVSWDSEANSR